VDTLAQHGSALRRRLHAALAALPGVRVLSPDAPDALPIVSFVTDSVDAATMAARLDREHGVLCRHGLHCAPGAHRVLGTVETGAVRFSAGWCTTDADVDRAVDAVAAVLADGGGTHEGVVV
jgi:cysteine desulfurase / selenocysteine lyase